MRAITRFTATAAVAAALVLGAATPGGASTRSDADTTRDPGTVIAPGESTEKKEPPIRCLSLGYGNLWLCQMDIAGVKAEFLCDAEEKTCELHKGF